LQVPKEKKQKRWGGNNNNNTASKRVTITPSDELTKVMTALSLVEEKAKRARLEIWRFGDIAEEDDEES